MLGINIVDKYSIVNSNIVLMLLELPPSRSRIGCHRAMFSTFYASTIIPICPDDILIVHHACEIDIDLGHFVQIPPHRFMHHAKSMKMLKFFQDARLRQGKGYRP